MPGVPTAKLEKEQFVSLTTFRKDGRSVPTAVWFGMDGDRLYVYTLGSSGKVKRIRRNGHVTVAPCDRSGKVTGAAFDATARVLSADEGKAAEKLITKKYGLQKRLFSAVQTLIRLVQRRKPDGVYLEISPA